MNSSFFANRIPPEESPLAWAIKSTPRYSHVRPGSSEFGGLKKSPLCACVDSLLVARTGWRGCGHGEIVRRKAEISTPVSLRMPGAYLNLRFGIIGVQLRTRAFAHTPPAESLDYRTRRSAAEANAGSDRKRAQRPTPPRSTADGVSACWRAWGRCALRRVHASGGY